jgi:hypothetical protein
MDSTTSPKVNTMEGKGVGVCSLARSTSRVEGCARALRWGLGKLTINSITYQSFQSFCIMENSNLSCHSHGDCSST